MPITTVGSYLPTMNQFLNHWELVNDFLVQGGGADLTLKNSYDTAELFADRLNVQSAILALQPADNTRTNTAADRDIKKAAIRVRLSQFRGTVNGLLQGTFYVRSLPKMPTFGVNEARYLAPFDDMANLWSQINAAPPPGFTGPLKLAGGYTLALFNTELGLLRAAYVAADTAIQNATIARARRDVLLPPVRTRLLQYRSAVVGALPPDNPLLLTVPAYSPPPGSTPAAVSASGLWSAAQGQGVLTWTASDNPDLDHYSVRTAPGPNYRAADETAVAAVPPGTLTLSTLDGLAAPGSEALFRVYVVLTTDNERGSATVKITRPA